MTSKVANLVQVKTKHLKARIFHKYHAKALNVLKAVIVGKIRHR